VVEIGAGTGVLTAALSARARAVVAIERDRDLVPLLTRAFAERANVRVVEADAVTAPLAELLGDEAPRVLCGNLPYQLTGRLLSLATEHVARLERAVFMVQAEVGERILAAPGTKEYGALSVFVTAAFDARRVLKVSRGCFFPAPDVESCVLELVPRRARIEETEKFRKVVKAAFAQRRKTLRNAWRALGTLEELQDAARAAGTTLDARGEVLTADQFARAAQALPD
jgi:16S rRNA (adenine1518-N6/adenine1519-N6)-dimethyltransferase